MPKEAQCCVCYMNKYDLERMINISDCYTINNEKY